MENKRVLSTWKNVKIKLPDIFKVSDYSREIEKYGGEWNVCYSQLRSLVKAGVVEKLNTYPVTYKKVNRGS